jgi:hypothetical protein
MSSDWVCVSRSKKLRTTLLVKEKEEVGKLS